MAILAYVDPLLHFRTMQELGKLNKKIVSTETSIITANGQPIAVMIPYESYLELQGLLELPKEDVKVRVAGAGKD